MRKFFVTAAIIIFTILFNKYDQQNCMKKIIFINNRVHLFKTQKGRYPSNLSEINIYPHEILGCNFFSYNVPSWGNCNYISYNHGHYILSIDSVFNGCLTESEDESIYLNSGRYDF